MINIITLTLLFYKIHSVQVNKNFDNSDHLKQTFLNYTNPLSYFDPISSQLLLETPFNYHNSIPQYNQKKRFLIQKHLENHVGSIIEPKYKIERELTRNKINTFPKYHAFVSSIMGSDYYQYSQDDIPVLKNHKCRNFDRLLQDEDEMVLAVGSINNKFCVGKYISAKNFTDRPLFQIARNINIMKALPKEHPYVFPLHEVGFIDGTLAFEDPKGILISMPFVQQISLQTLQRSFKETARYFKEILVNLDQLASVGLMHRDLKPTNTMRYQHNKTYVIIDYDQTDFYVPFEKASTSIGNKMYKAPEVLLGFKFHDYRLDTWALGQVMYRILYRERLVDENDSDEYSLVRLAEVFKLDEIIRLIGKFQNSKIARKFKRNPGLFFKKLKFEYRGQKVFTYRQCAESFRGDHKLCLAHDFMEKMLRLDFNERWEARDLLRHKFLELARVNKHKDVKEPDFWRANRKKDKVFM